jgi:hypothetical protein
MHGNTSAASDVTMTWGAFGTLGNTGMSVNRNELRRDQNRIKTPACVNFLGALCSFRLSIMDQVTTKTPPMAIDISQVGILAHFA